jgi:hypothetical protein
MNWRQKHVHLMHMRYLVYKDAVVKAIKSAHEEMVDYVRAVNEMIERSK